MNIEISQVINFILPLLVGVVAFFLKRLLDDSKLAVIEAQKRLEESLEKASVERKSLAIEIRRTEEKINEKWQETKDKFHELRSSVAEIRGEGMMDLGDLDKKFVIFSTDIDRKHHDNKTLLLEVRGDNLKVQQQLTQLNQSIGSYDAKVILLEDKVKALMLTQERYFAEVQELRRMLKVSK